MKLDARTRSTLAWSLWLATIGCCATGLLVTLAPTRPLTVGVLARGTALALAFPLGFVTVELLVSLRRPANPIGWLYGAAGLVWELQIPVRPGWSTCWAPISRCRRPPSWPPPSATSTRPRSAWA